MKMLSSDSAYDLGIAGIKWAEVLPWLSGTAFFYTFTFAFCWFVIVNICISMLNLNQFNWFLVILSSYRVW